MHIEQVTAAAAGSQSRLRGNLEGDAEHISELPHWRGGARKWERLHPTPAFAG